MSRSQVNDHNINIGSIELSNEVSPLIEQAHQTHLIKGNMLDIFKYDQIPSVQRKISFCSLIWSFLLLTGFFWLSIYTIYEFITNNPPSLNLFQTNLPDSNNYTLPQIAISFVSDGKIATSDIYDIFIFNVSMDQVFDGLDSNKTYINIPMQRCTKEQVKWIKKIKRNLLLCPVKLPNLSGLLNISPHFQYARVVVNLCDTSTSSTCETNQTRIGQVLAGGRMFLYIEQPHQVKLKNFEQNKSVRFQTYQIFLQQGQYTRNEIILRSTQYIIYPDYLTQFGTKYPNLLTTSGNINSFVSNVTAIESKSIFEVWFRLDSQIQNIEAVYLTSIDKIAIIGALWGVFYPLFFWFSYKCCKKWQDSNKSINPPNEKDTFLELQAQVKTLNDRMILLEQNSQKNRQNFDQS